MFCGVNLNADGAPLDDLELDGVFADGDAVAAGAEGDEGRAPDVEVVTAGDEGADLPADPAVGFDVDEDCTLSPVLAEAEEVEGRDGDVSAVDKRRPNINLFVALIGGRDGGAVGDLLAPVSDVGFEAVVVDSDVVVRVARDKRDLEVRCQEIGHGGVEGVNGDVLESESRFGWSKDGPYEKNSDQDKEEEHHYAPEHSLEDPPLLSLVVLALLHRHRLLLFLVSRESV